MVPNINPLERVEYGMNSTEYAQTPDEIAVDIHPKKRRLLEALTQDSYLDNDGSEVPGEHDSDSTQCERRTYTTREVTQYAGHTSKDLYHWFGQSKAEGLIEELGQAEGVNQGKLWRITDRGLAVVKTIGEERDGGPETVQELATDVASLESAVDSNQMMIKRHQTEIAALSDAVETGNNGSDEEMDEIQARVDACEERVEEYDEMLVSIMDVVDDVRDRVEALEETCSDR